MVERNTSGLLEHPYDRLVKSDRLKNNKHHARNFWAEIFFCEKDEWQALNPEAVIERFNEFKGPLLAVNPVSLPYNGEGIENFSLYDVWVWGLWDTNRDVLFGIHPDKRSIRNIRRTAHADQVLALIEDSMDMAGHRPAEGTDFDHL